MLGSIALILSGRCVILKLRRNPNVSTITKVAFISSSLAFCGVDNDGGTAAGLGGREGKASADAIGSELGEAPSESGVIGIGCTIRIGTPSEGRVVVGDFWSHVGERISSLFAVCSIDVVRRVSQFGGIASPDKYSAVENVSSKIT